MKPRQGWHRRKNVRFVTDAKVFPSVVGWLHDTIAQSPHQCIRFTAPTENYSLLLRVTGECRHSSPSIEWFAHENRKFMSCSPTLGTDYSGGMLHPSVPFQRAMLRESTPGVGLVQLPANGLLELVNLFRVSEIVSH